MCGMVRMTIQLSDRLKAALARAAERSGESQAGIIRRGVATAVAKVAQKAARRPRIPLFASGDPGLAERVGEGLRGFGE